MENSISRQNVNVNVRAVVTDPNVTVQYKTKILQKNVVGGVNTLVPAMISEVNVKYVIKYDYTLGENIIIPANCVLEFDGGSIANASGNTYSITGNNTGIIWNNKIPIFGNRVVIASNGTWNVPYISSKMFSNLNYTNSLRDLMALNNPDIQTEIVVEKENYSYPISISSNHEYGIQIESNTKFILNGIISLEANSLQAYSIIEVYLSKNIKICGSGSIIGDLDSHTGTDGEWGHCITITGSEDIVVLGLNISKAWGDGMYIANGLITTPSQRVLVENCEIHNCRRQGITVGKTIDVIIQNNYIHDISGTNPQSAIDVECNINETIENVIIQNNTIEDCVSGIFSMAMGTYIKNVYINNNLLKNITTAGIGIGKTTKNVSIIQNRIEGNCTTGISISEIDTAYLNNNYVENASDSAFTVVIVHKIIATNNKFIGNKIVFHTIYDESEFSNNYFKGDFISLNNNTNLSLKNNSFITLDTSNDYSRIYAKVIENNNIVFSRHRNEIGARFINGNKISVTVDFQTNEYWGSFYKVQTISNNIIEINGRTLIYFSINSLYDGIDHADINKNTIINENVAQCIHVVYGASKVCGIDNVINGSYYNAFSSSESNVATPNTFIYHDKVGSSRPSLKAQEVWVEFFDTTLGKPIYWNGTAWVDATGATV